MFGTKEFTKGLAEKMEFFKLLVFSKIVENLFYCPNHWVTITNTQYKVFFAHFILQLLKYKKLKFETTKPNFLKYIN